jgi:hypothetical protein
MLHILEGVLPFLVITLYAVACLRSDRTERPSQVQDFRAACERAAEREKALHPWFNPTESSRSAPGPDVKAATNQYGWVFKGPKE